MKYISSLCSDVGTVNCPCPLAETGDCLVCGRLCGKDCSDCRWTGVCIYNEYIQNDEVIRNRRKNSRVQILEKIKYGDDIMVMAIKVSRRFALEASWPGSFVFVASDDTMGFSNVPISVMRVDESNGILYIAFKIISSKTKRLAEANDSVFIRGVYRNGLIGKGLVDMERDVLGGKASRSKWLMITKGMGVAPAVNILKWAKGRVEAKLLLDEEKVGKEFVEDCFEKAGLMNKKTEDPKENEKHSSSAIDIKKVDLSKLIEKCDEKNSHGYESNIKDFYKNKIRNFDRIFILGSDYYISQISARFDIPLEKLIFSNNFNMCCGEGICGACSHTDCRGISKKMCKCRDVDVSELIPF